LGESTPLAFKKDKFMMIASENFWLSSTPSVAGSTYEGSDQSSCPRICTVATLVHIETGKKLVFLNTHTDHAGSLARTLESAQILQYLSEKGLPSIVTGDLNATPDSTEIIMLSSSKNFPMTDVTASVKGSFHGFGVYSDEDMPKIDYVFSNLPCIEEEAFAIPDPHEDGIYISDHRPVMTSLVIE
jgi:endonuclease/exonuclease/phosphatase family metal-dependent hydrolase